MLLRETEAKRSWVVWVTVCVASVVMMSAVFTNRMLIAEIVAVQVDDLLLLLLTLLYLGLVLLGVRLMVVCFQPVSVTFLHLQVLLLLVNAAGSLPRREGWAICHSDAGSCGGRRASFR